MTSLNHALVVIELNEHDDVVFEYVNRMAEHIGFKSITFLHVTGNAEIPQEILDKYPGLVVPADQSLKSVIKSKLSTHSYLSGFKNINIEIMEGNRIQSISKFVREHDIDLTFLSRWNNEPDLISTLKKIARNLSCSFSLVPPAVPEKINKLLVPVDFSKHSIMALDFALSLASKREGVEVHGLYVYRVPSGYTKMGLSYDEFAAEMVKSAKEQTNLILRENNLDASKVIMHYMLKKDDQIPYMINRFAFMNQVDAIVMGSRGRNTLSSFVLGSITEALINRDQYLPLIVVKNKGEIMKVWSALLEL